MKNKRERPAKRTLIGGQALIEGIMMRGPATVATVVRKADGSHVVKEDKAPKRGRLGKLPFVRGALMFWDSLKLGISCLMFSADQSFDDLVNEGEENKEPQKEKKPETLGPVMMAFTVALGVALPVGLFMLLPAFLSSVIGLGKGTVYSTLFEAALKLIFFVAFLWLTSLMKDMKRVYAYHGAEHKAIHCYEAGEELTVENIQKHTRKHPRCGTSFLFVVIIISIILFTLFWWIENIWLKMALRLALLPAIVGMTYELNRLVGRHDNWLTVAIRSPGVALQAMTTKEPDDSMVEVAIDALSRVIPEDGAEDKW